MNDRLRALRDAIHHPEREVEVSPDGEVREIRPEGDAEEPPESEERSRKPTKLAKRTFGDRGGPA
jgi:hypothetical protein